MKLYIKALLDYEKNNDSFELLYNFMTLKQSYLLNLYCDGKINLPSFILLKKLKEKYSDLARSDEELNSLFETAIECSKIFYSQTLKIIGTENIKFENLFSQQARPIGQQLINLLVSIKFRIKLIKLNSNPPKKPEILHILQKVSIFINYLRTILNGVLYKVSLLQSTNYKYTPIIYFISVLLILSTMLVTLHYFISSLSTIQTTGLDIMFGILIAIIAILFYPVRHFGKTDINGKDILAYKYRVFFNNTSDKKMYQLFALPDSNISRQKISQSIDSP